MRNSDKHCRGSQPTCSAESALHGDRLLPCVVGSPAAERVPQAGCVGYNNTEM